MKNFEYLKKSDFQKIKWSPYDKNPIIQPQFYSPIIADPTFLTPESTPEQEWVLFAHSILGIHKYTSKNGIDFSHKGLKFTSAMRPFVIFDNGKYYLFYEKYRNLQLLYAMLPMIPWKSRIELRVSSDLNNWSDPVTALSPSLSWHKNTLGDSVGNPCVVKEKKHFLLFYSSSLVTIPDCGFNEPEFIGVSRSKSIDSTFVSEPSPIIQPDKADDFHNLSSGSIKVIRIQDGYIGFQNRIYYSKNDNRSGSAVFILYSKNCIQWDLLKKDPIVFPTSGWMKSHVYAVDVRYYNGRIFLFFNARNDWHWSKGKEAIGLMFGDL